MTFVSLLLASASPRRRQIISRLGLPFMICTSPVDEDAIQHSRSCATPVLMRPYSEQEVDAYIATGDPLDKAGAYGIQHPEFQPTERIKGCYLNVVGLPLCVLLDLLAEFNVHPATEGRTGPGCPWSEQCLWSERCLA
jgi:predicted house-cleaning NTP pyrophosphatase (Maf/HAM1 superfamily)